MRALALATLALSACTHEVARAGRTGGLRVSGAECATTGVEEGVWTWWYPDGELREQGAFADGVRCGIWTQWYPNGQKRSQGERRSAFAGGPGEREGVWVFWHPNGRESARGVYRAGQRIGRWEYTNQ